MQHFAMYEAKERQKFISDAQYLREMQHKMDTDYQACLRKKDHNTQQPEKKREQLARQELRQTNMSSISVSRSYERQWISRLPMNRQTCLKKQAQNRQQSEKKREQHAIQEPRQTSMSSVSVLHDYEKPCIPQLPVNRQISSLEVSGCEQKTEKGTCSKKDISAFQKPILLRRQRMSQKSFLENPDSENVKRTEGKERTTPVLQATAKASRGSGSQDGTKRRISPVPKSKKKSQERVNLVQAPKLSISCKKIVRDRKKGTAFTAAHQLPTHPTDSTIPITNGPSASSESTSSSLPPIKNILVRPKEDDSYAVLCSNAVGPTTDGENTKEVNQLKEDLVSFDLNNSPSCGQSDRINRMSLTQPEHSTYELGVGDNAQRVELPHPLARQHNPAVEPASEQTSIGPRQTRDLRKSYPLEDAHINEGEKSAMSTRNPCAESRSERVSSGEPSGNLNPTEDWSGSNIYGRERQAFENSQRCHAGFLSSVRPAAQQPSVRSPFNIPGSLVQATSRAEVSGNVDVAAASEQVTELNGSPRFISRRPLSPIRMRDSFSAPESCPFSSPTIGTPEDGSLHVDSPSHALSSVSPSIASHEEDALLNSHSSSSSSNSSQPSLFRANFTAHLHMAGSLPDQMPIFLTVSDLRNENGLVSGATVCSPPNAKESNKPAADPEKLNKIRESLLAEDSEEEGDLCRICQMAGGSISNLLLEPCGCGGTLRFVHQECLKTWLKAKIKAGADLGAVKTCELCKQSLTADLDDFNVNDYYRNHQQSRAQSELMNSGLYLVLLLHLYEQRFAELMRLNYNQASRERLSRQPRTEENQNPSNSGNIG